MKNKFLTITRVTGLFYLGLMLTGILVFIFALGEIYTGGDVPATTANLVNKASLARLGIWGQWLMAVLQAVAAVSFYMLFRKTNGLAAGILVIFGFVSAIMIGVSAVLGSDALNGALAGESSEVLFNSFTMLETLWSALSLSFGLWLLPIGYLAAKVKMPIVLVILLFLDAGGYIAAALMFAQTPDFGRDRFYGLVVFPASIVEFWLAVYLLVIPKLKVESLAPPVVVAEQ